ncbi:hypothetical protein [Burkholderia cepacia]|uniref:hypothetical protein n=1 Tax=Burkholderia cepacia TaxID=292 RepID=UPI00264BBC12|nr:hypothetical protein [Burkholderia cepacia]MDN7638123.1 hypothetical protein [Burkholderia cepacia]
MATITVYVKLKGDDAAKAIAATEAIDDGFTLIVKDADKVVARFQLDRVEHWY